MRKLLCLSLLAATPLFAQGTTAQDAATMAAQARTLPLPYAYESGVVLDGLTAQWQATADGPDFAAIKAAVDKWVDKDGNLIPGEKPFQPEAHSLDNIEPGRAILLCYRVTGDARYYKVAKFLYEQFATQPRTPEGGYWHKGIYPQQMWADGAYMAEPFRAAYAATFQDSAAFDDIAKQFLLMYDKLRDERTGLLRHGWDSAHTQPWADKTTGRSPESWARAVGWYEVALVDTLQWFPAEHRDRAKLLVVLGNVAASIAKTQQPSGLWLDVLSQPKREGNFEEASASEMFVYALAKGVRLGYLPVKFEPIAQHGWKGVQTKFVTHDAGGTITLHGTVKVSGLGGSPYRAGDFNYYIHESTADNETKGVGMYLMAASEMQQAETATADRGKTVLLDAWFNSQTRKNAAGQTESFHYKWNDDQNSGFAFFGRAFQRFGANLAELHEAPTSANLRGAKVYVIPSPDIPIKNPTPHYMDKASGDAIEAWVKDGGVLLMMENDPGNSEFEHFNTLADRFGLHFNPVLRNTVQGSHFEQGRQDIPAGTGGIFPDALQTYMKEICTIQPTGVAKAIYTDKGDVLMAVAHIGKGTVYAMVDPWLYNEYTDGRKLPPAYKDFAAAIDLARWSLAQAK